jgi:hypothetical protein
MSHKSIEDLWSISKVKSENGTPWTKAEHNLLVTEMRKLLKFMRKEREGKLTSKLQELEETATPTPDTAGGSF